MIKNWLFSIFSALYPKNMLSFWWRSANNPIYKLIQSILLFVVIHKINNKNSQKEAAKDEG